MKSDKRWFTIYYSRRKKMSIRAKLEVIGGNIGKS